MTSSRNPRSFTHGQACALPSPPKVGAVCLNGARTELCGGRRVTCVPTAILSLRCSHSVCFVRHLIRGPAGRPTPALDPRRPLESVPFAMQQFLQHSARRDALVISVWQDLTQD